MSNPEKSFNSEKQITKQENEPITKVLDMLETIYYSDLMAHSFNNLSRHFDISLENFMDISFELNKDEIFRITAKDEYRETTVSISDDSFGILEYETVFDDSNPLYVERISISVGSDDVNTYAIVQLEANIDDQNKEIFVGMSADDFINNYTTEIINLAD